MYTYDNQETNTCRHPLPSTTASPSTSPSFARAHTFARSLSLYIRSEAIKRFQQATKGGLAQNPGDIVAVAALREEEDAEMGVEYDY